MKGTRRRGREDWMHMTLADVLDVTPSEWMERTYGDLMQTRPSEWVARATDVMRSRASDWWALMYGSAAGPGTWSSKRMGEHYRDHGYGCGCEECGHGKRYRYHGPGCGCDECEHRCCRRCAPESCECYCCIGDVDLVVYARVGEQRVIPIVVENERRRDKQITLELSPWTTRGGNPAPVDTLLLEPKTFSLPACGEQKVTLVVRIRGVDPATGQPGTVQPSPGLSTGGQVGQVGQREPGETPGTPERQIPDVDSCLVVTADLRLVGCDHRPIRIAVAILPRDCDPYTVSCGCTCC